MKKSLEKLPEIGNIWIKSSKYKFLEEYYKEFLKKLEFSRGECRIAVKPLKKNLLEESQREFLHEFMENS